MQNTKQRKTMSKDHIHVIVASSLGRLNTWSTNGTKNGYKDIFDAEHDET
jgi:hypothetical protein